MQTPWLIFVAAMSLSVWGCAVEPDSELRGTCSLSCSGAKVPGGEFVLEPLLEDAVEVSLACDADFRAQNTSILPYNKPLQVKYYIYELVPNFGGRPVDPRDDPPGVEKPQNPSVAENPVERVPRAGIGFEPMVFGAMATEKTNPELYDGEKVSSGKFDGVVTPRGEWCSDSCGVMTYEFWPTCLEGKENPITATIVAAGAKVRKSFKFTLTNDSDQN